MSESTRVEVESNDELTEGDVVTVVFEPTDEVELERAEIVEKQDAGFGPAAYFTLDVETDTLELSTAVATDRQTVYKEA
jgi:hypothetical protein